MASTSSSTSRPNDQPSTTKFDVFLSFRGEDTRHTFTDHLYHALLQAGVSTFRDNDEIDRGQQLKPEIEAAIIASRASVLVLSENYASSRWSETNFIAEVVEMVQCKLDLKLLSIPAHLIGMETRVDVINSWFRNDQSSAIAICGMGGSGKTTLSEYMYNLHKHDFESSSFVEEIGKRYKDNLLKLQKQLLRDVLGGKKISL